MSCQCGKRSYAQASKQLQHQHLFVAIVLIPASKYWVYCLYYTKCYWR
ncbi:hypothetical protein AB205_0189180 [Aquarana catesbeiana]|uniref:Uncharacterized protein n=1 Tax=Aquarana catesbeiana TaxID=8400 RepID=A0A2G9SH58_AQUCT|nr:hypothetical protein AB205_0189180 [Aquarana catesbeiana]